MKRNILYHFIVIWHVLTSVWTAVPYNITWSLIYDNSRTGWRWRDHLSGFHNISVPISSIVHLLGKALPKQHSLPRTCLICHWRPCPLMSLPPKYFFLDQSYQSPHTLYPISHTPYPIPLYYIICWVGSSEEFFISSICHICTGVGATDHCINWYVIDDISRTVMCIEIAVMISRLTDR